MQRREGSTAPLTNMDSTRSSDNTEIVPEFNVPDTSWVVHDAPERPRRQWVFVAAALAVICVGAWILQNLWDSSSVVELPPVTTQSAVPEPIPESPLPDETAPEEPPIVTGQPLVSLLDEWPGIAGAMILRGGARSDQLEDVDVILVGDQLSDPIPVPGSTANPLWLSADGTISAYPSGVARSDGGDWSWIAKADTIIDPNEGALWVVDHERRVIAFVYKDPITRYEAYALDPEVEQVLGRLENGFLVVRGLDSGGSEFANWTDDGPIVAIEGLAGRKIVDIGSSVVLVVATQDQIVAMDVTEPDTVTAIATINLDFDVQRACLSPDETLVAVLGSQRFVVVEMDPRVEYVDEPLVDDFTWTGDRHLVFTRRNSLLASDLDSAPVRVAELSADYSWQVASSTSAC